MTVQGVSSVLHSNSLKHKAAPAKGTLFSFRTDLGLVSKSCDSKSVAGNGGCGALKWEASLSYIENFPH